MKIVKGILAAGLLTGLTATAAQAQDYSWYLGAGVGVNLMNDTDVTTEGRFGGVTYNERNIGNAEADLGWALVGSVGVPLSPWFRVEGEIGWRSNDLDRGAANSLNGDLNIFTYMANAYLDIPTGTALTPYVGVGVGGATMWLDGNAGAFGGIDDDSTVFAYQVIAGLGYRLSREVSIKADYRYFATAEAEFDTTGGMKQRSDFDSHTFLVGFTYHFGAPAAAPVPVAAPAPAAPPAPRNFIVFFDWDKADLTPEAQAILRQAADYIKKGGITRITLTGHADRSGTDSYNVRLSQRRGENVQKFLVNLGVANNSMSILAKGESTPLVPTADNVREPQNRRVEIVM